MMKMFLNARKIEILFSQKAFYIFIMKLHNKYSNKIVNIKILKK